MGIYVYNVRKSNAKKANLNGTSVEVHTCKYTCRYSSLPSQAWPWDRKHAYPYDAIYASIERAWGDAKPMYVVLEHDNTVYRWTGNLTWYDSDKIPGEPVGKLVKRGGRWVVENIVVQ